MSISDNLISKYDCFVFDLSGIIHDGVKLIDTTIAFIANLRAAKKQIVYLSNSSGPATDAIESLRLKGFDLLPEEKLVTSGEYFRDWLGLHKEMLSLKYFNLGQNYAPYKGLDLEFVSNHVDADYILVSLFLDEPTFEDEMGKWQQLIDMIIETQKPVLCVNPDIVANNGKYLRKTPGYFAKILAQGGLEVQYFGKPIVGIYEYTLDGLGIAKDKMLMIGDSVITDVKGADTYGIDSILVTKDGILKSLSDEALELLCKKSGVTPTYTFQEL